MSKNDKPQAPLKSKTATVPKGKETDQISDTDLEGVAGGVDFVTSDASYRKSGGQ